MIYLFNNHLRRVDRYFVRNLFVLCLLMELNQMIQDNFQIVIKAMKAIILLEGLITYLANMSDKNIHSHVIFHFIVLLF